MDLFGEPELGTDYIIRRRKNGHSVRWYSGVCAYCNRKGFFKRRLHLNNQYCNRICYNKHHSKLIQGLNNPNWKGGRTSKIVILRESKDYYDWRTQVYERDDYTCQDCGQRGGDLQAHHMITVAESYDLMFDVDNGRTLCVPCHRIIKDHEIEYREELFLYE